MAISTRTLSESAPATQIAPITPDDAADLPQGVCRALYAGGAGAVAVVDMQGNSAVIQSGDFQYHPVRVRRVLAAGTTATDLLALY